ncbi:uncharacterized protein SPAR_P02880 [Saccharomyces paradoxus]|uniref:GATA-type domain-containing protein n=1 Tax=Saccharomyces paradoxus TaxID=27291 RepID=A0A8B8V192_SACPA|nr:uncharacterized protein SPAR_P02880 [Saccharomyces paradoxus]QHS76753.1 hypothetical protein SPAR_P02880 [Saccharomyces paradoxus]
MYVNIITRNLSCEQFRRISVESLLNKEESMTTLLVAPMNSGSTSKNMGPIFLKTDSYKRRQKVPITKTCNQCNEIKTSSQWREGPTGGSCLCNACGLFYRKLFLAFGKHAAKRYLEEIKNTGAKRRIPRSLYGVQRSS